MTFSTKTTKILISRERVISKLKLGDVSEQMMDYCYLRIEMSYDRDTYVEVRELTLTGTRMTAYLRRLHGKIKI